MHYSEQTGTVLETRDENAVIHLNPDSNASCGMGCKCCSATSGPTIMEIKAEGLEPGDKVRVRTPRLNPYLGMLFTFGLPLIFFVAGFFIGNNFEAPEGSGNIAVLGGVIGLLIAFITAWVINRLLRPDEEPTVEKITSS